MTDSPTVPAGHITVERAEEIFWGSERIAMQDVSHHRWYVKQLIVFKDDQDDLRGFYYLHPSTELQEDQERFEADPVPVFPVTYRTETVVIYEKAAT